MSVCDQCAARGALIADHAGAIESLSLDRWELVGLLSLPDERLTATVRRSTRRLQHARVRAVDHRAETGHRTEHARARTPRINALPAQAGEGTRGACSSNSTGLCRHDPRYPERLAHLDGPPAALHIASDRPGRLLDLLARPVVAIVGSRESTYYARDTATALARDLAHAGVTVLGGLAEGIESAAQQGALGAGGGTIAVMAGGADVAYPVQSDRVHMRVREKGAAVSELPFGSRPAGRWCFLARNRMIAALADAVIVVEAGESAGTLFTAELACRLGREVGVVPGRTSDPCARGSNALLRDGAQPILNAIDALALIETRQAARSH